MTARVHPRTPTAEGLGLGLDLAREVVAAHGRRIRFEIRPAEGRTFTVDLPFARLPIHSIRRMAA